MLRAMQAHPSVGDVSPQPRLSIETEYVIAVSESRELLYQIPRTSWSHLASLYRLIALYYFSLFMYH